MVVAQKRSVWQNHATHVAEVEASIKLTRIPGNVAIHAMVGCAMKVKWCNAGAVVVQVTLTDKLDRLFLGKYQH